MFRHAPVRAAVGLLVGFAAAWATFFVVDRYGERDLALEVPLGAIDFDDYCAVVEPDLAARLIADDAYGWRCVGTIDGFFTIREVDVDSACQAQYQPESSARLVDESDPEGWRCFSGAGTATG